MTPDAQPPIIVAPASEPGWSTKEYVEAMEGRIAHRFDRQDDVLERLDRRLDSTATKEDMAAQFREVHQRIDGVEERIVPLEAAAADERAVDVHRGRRRVALAWAGGIVSALAVVAAVVVPFLVH